MKDQPADPQTFADHEPAVAGPETIDATGAYQPAPQTEPHFPAPPADAPIIPGYTIIGEIARGGMGCVYAGRELTLDREVAIKTLLPQPNAERFITESKITAKLPHPNIPPVYALGTLGDGSPYLTMKLIRGRTLADELKARAAVTAELPRFLQIFEQIAQAVGFAHAQGIIHRDLKPANVMVGEFGEVQVMDWGLAKHLTNRQPEQQPQVANSQDDQLTQAGAVMGTPAYMAPEQARGQAVDARADVFALGGILTAILTGKAVFSGTTARETITRAASGDTAESLARLDGCGADTELVQLAKQCLAISADQRPADGQAVAKLVAAYRHGVDERLKQAETDRASSLVRVVETRKRQRAMLVAGSVIASILVAGLVVSLLFLNRATIAEVQANANAEQARDERDAKGIALQAEKVAKQEALTAAEKERLALQAEVRERKFAVAIADFVKDDFLSLTSVDGQDRFGGAGLNRNATLLDLLNRAAEKLQKRKDLDPLIEAELSWMIGVNYRGIGAAANGIPFLKRSVELSKNALGSDHKKTLNAQNSLAATYGAAGQLDFALPLYIETFKLRKATLGTEDSATLNSMNNLGLCYLDVGKRDLAIPIFEEALKLRKSSLGLDHTETLTSMNNLAMGYKAAGKFDLAVSLHEETLTLRKAKLGPDHPHTLVSMNNLANSYMDTNQLDLALPLHEKTLALRKEKLEPDHPDTLRSRNNLASAYRAAKKFDEALELCKETLEIMKAKQGPDHPDTLSCMNNLAAVYRETGKVDQAIVLIEETLRLRKAKLGPDHPSTLISMNNLAGAYWSDNKLDRAIPLYEETIKRMKVKLGPEHPNTLGTMSYLGQALCEAKQGEKAVVVYRDYIEAKRKLFPNPDTKFASLLDQASSELMKCDQFATAEEMLRESHTIRDKKEPDDWRTFDTQSMLGGALLGQKKYEDAEPLLLKSYDGMKAREMTIPPKSSTRIPDAIERLIELYTATKKPDQVKKWQDVKDKLPKPEVAPTPKPMEKK